ncbi:MAG: alpha-ketoglutarate-dependent dioxygenase AlkB [Pseudomonadota bacterium]
MSVEGRLHEYRQGLVYRYFAGFATPSTAQRWFDALRDEVPWEQSQVRVYGRTHRTPRLTAWVADAGVEYRYSGQSQVPSAWSATSREIRERVQRATGHEFNGVLLNLYRSGDDTVGWHSDDEAALGEAPVIASVSLGEARRMRFRPRPGAGHRPPVATDDEPRRELLLEHGSLLLMEAGTQRGWQHCVPRCTRTLGARINLTFRFLYR